MGNWLNSDTICGSPRRDPIGPYVLARTDVFNALLYEKLKFQRRGFNVFVVAASQCSSNAHVMPPQQDWGKAEIMSCSQCPSAGVVSAAPLRTPPSVARWKSTHWLTCGQSFGNVCRRHPKTEGSPRCEWSLFLSLFHVSECICIDFT